MVSVCVRACEEGWPKYRHPSVMYFELGFAIIMYVFSLKSQNRQINYKYTFISCRVGMTLI
jgi:hypothetical protein